MQQEIKLTQDLLELFLKCLSRAWLLSIYEVSVGESEGGSFGGAKPCRKVPDTK